jgi:DNA-binding transcriptional LysR family regulator
MPDLNWNDLRHLLALSRDGSLAAAARRLGVDETTVARRLKAAEAALASRLFERTGEGALRPTPAGEAAVALAERVEQLMHELRDTAAGADAAAAGAVRLTSVPMLINRLLIPALPALRAAHPAIRLELVAEPRPLSLMKREADIALRLARPAADAGAGVRARRIGRLSYAVFVPAACPRGAEGRLPWVTYEEAMSGLPQARWIAAAVKRERGAVAVAVNDAEAIVEAVRAGLGRSLLPQALVGADPALRRGRLTGLPPLPERELWLLTHPDQSALSRVTAVVAWVEATVRRLDDRG